MRSFTPHSAGSGSSNNTQREPLPSPILPRVAPHILLTAGLTLVALPVGVALTRAFAGPLSTALNQPPTNPAAATTGAALNTLGTNSTPLSVALTTLAVPLAIAAAATLIAWPIAWLLRSLHTPRTAPLAWALLLLPLLMPQYLAYAGLGLARAPGTWLGEITHRWPSDLNVALGRGLAVAGLIAWSTPIAALVLAGPVRRLDQDLLDQLRLTTANRFTLLRQHTAMLRAPLLLSILVITLLMIGSPVPLHLAQVPTLAIDLWAQLALDPSSPAAWRAAWPLLLLSIAGAAFLAWAITRHAPHDPKGEPPATTLSPTRVALPLLWWCIALPLPLLIFSTTLQHPRLLTDFWRQNAQALLTSLTIATATGALFVLLATLAWLGSQTPRGRILTGVALGVWLFGLLIPGVLLGGAFAGLGGAYLPRILSENWAFVAMCHVSHFGAIGIALGMWLERLEPQSLRDARRLAGGNGVRGWWTLAARPHLTTLIGVGVAGGCASLHEIEATVQVAPPGFGSLATVMLNHLHMNSVQELAAAGINVLGVGLVAGLAGGWLLGGFGRR